MNFIIKGDKTARQDTPALCTTCVNSMIVKGVRPSEVSIQCFTNGPWTAPTAVHWHVTECTSYVDKSLTSLEQMEKIAYRFSVDDRKKTMGFMTATQWKSRHPDGGPGDDYEV